MAANNLTQFKSQLIDTINELIRLYYAIDKAQRCPLDVNGWDFYELIDLATLKAGKLNDAEDTSRIVELTTGKPTFIYDLEDCIREGDRSYFVRREIAELAVDYPEEFYRLFRLFNEVQREN